MEVTNSFGGTMLLPDSNMNFHDDSECDENLNSCDSASEMSSLSSKKSTGKSADLDFTRLGLHGRSQETATILQAYRRISVEGGHAELILIKGESGIGKSALVEDMRKTIISGKPGGLYIQGKFDQMKRMEALSALVAAFSDLCDLILVNENLLDFRIAIREALGDDAQLLGNVIPNLATITGDHSYDTMISEDPEWPSSSAKLPSLFRAFLRAVSSPSSPILIHLDDIHWADDQSQDIVKALVLDTELKNILIVCTYINNAEGEKIRRHICGGDALEGLCLTEIELGSISPDAAMSMLTDLLDSSEGDLESLCDFITTKTASNPYFICQFLELLQSQRLLRYSSNLCAWQFDMLTIRNETESSENVVDSVFQRIADLSPLVLGMMQLASCLGHKFDIALLEKIASSELDKADEQSWLTRNHALMKEYGSQESSAFQTIIRSMLATAKTKGFIDTMGEVGLYKFTHDRIQSGFYAMIPEVEREQLHFRIGMRLRQDIDISEIHTDSTQTQGTGRSSSIMGDSVLFIAVDQLNRGAAHVSDAAEKIAVASLNLAAAEQAIVKLTFSAASKFLRAGLNLLEHDKWETQHDLTRELSVKLAHSELCLGKFDASIVAADDVVNHTQNSRNSDRLKAYIIKIQCLGGKGKLKEATDLGLFALTLLGEVLSNGSIIEGMIEHKSDDELMNLPHMEDEDKLTVMRILASIVTYTYFDPDTTLARTSALRMIELSLSYGKAPSTPLCIACYGIFTSTSERVERVYRFGALALCMQEQLNAKEFAVLTTALVYCYAHHWRHPLRKGLGPLLKTYSIASESGNVETTLFNRESDYASMALHCGSVPLSVLEEEARAFAHKYAVKADNDVMDATIFVPFWQAEILPYLQAMLNLVGESENAVVLTGEVMDQDRLTQEAQESDNKLVTFSILFNRYFLATIFEEYEAAEACISELVPFFGCQSAKFHYSFCHLNFYRGLNYYGLFRITNEKMYLDNALDFTQQLSNSRYLGDANCLPMFLILSAESKAVSNNCSEAHQTYDRAILSAAEVGCLHIQALGNEKCGAMFLSQGQHEAAEVYLRRAISLLLQWGANAKVEHIEDKYRSLLFGAPDEVTLQFGTLTRSTVSEELSEESEESLDDMQIEPDESDISTARSDV